VKLIRTSGLVLAAWLAAVVALLALAAPASAHAVVLISDPPDGSRLEKAPTSVTVHFSESIGLNLGYLRVVDNSGRRVDQGNASHPNGDNAAITVSLQPGLGDGGYLASYRVVSADSHPIGGTIRFVVGNGSFLADTGSANASAVNRAVESALSTAHGLAFVGLALLGGAWVVFTIWPSGQQRRSVRRLVWVGWFATALATVFELVLQGAYGGGGPIKDVLKWTLLDSTLHDSTGQMLSFRLVLLGLLAAAFTALLGEWRGRPAWATEAAAILGLGVVVTFAASGHAQAANPRWFAILIAALHVLAMALWLGGLFVLMLAVRAPRGGAEDRTELLAGLPIFSRVALACIAVLTVTGTVQAWREIGSFSAIPGTWYGRLVVVKVAALGLIVVLGYLSRRIVLSRPTKTSALVQLRRTVSIEVVSAAVILAASSVLIIQPPAKTAVVIEHAKPRATTVKLTTASDARLQVTPGTHGPVQLSLDITGGATPLEVTATASLPSAQIGPIPVELVAANPRSYSASGLVLPSKGNWQIDVTVRTSQFDSTTAVATLRLY
jgi:copper transport protein